MFVGLMLFLALLLFAGYAKLSTVILNRILARPLPKWAIAAIEVPQLGLLPLYAVLLIQSFFQHGLWLRDRPWSDLSPFQGLLIVAGIIGFLLLVRSTWIFQRYRPPLCERAHASQLVDFRHSFEAQTWQAIYLGLGPMRGVALLPGNQQFTLEVSTKTYSLPRLPSEWDGLSIVHLADTHFRGAVTRAYFEAVCDQAIAMQPDLFVFTGDLLDDAELIDWLPTTLGRLRGKIGQYFILGNHDWYLDSNRVRAELEHLGWMDLSSRCIEVRPPNSKNSAPALVLAGDETPWMGTHPNLNQTSTDSFRILLSHTPDNIQWAQSQQIDLMLSGHTHGGQIQLPLLGPVYSPSRYGCRYASGVFWKAPTLLVVSRGISGREPIRYLCRPELTKVVLRTMSAQ